MVACLLPAEGGSLSQAEAAAEAISQGGAAVASAVAQVGRDCWHGSENQL